MIKRRLIGLAAVAAVVASVPPAGRAAGACTMLSDPAGDARLITESRDQRAPLGSVDRLDIVSGAIAMSDSLHVELTMRSLATAPGGRERDNYVVRFRDGARIFELRAVWSTGTWSFAETVTHDTWHADRAVTGDVDPARNTIAFILPMGRDIAGGDLLTQVQATAYDSQSFTASRSQFSAAAMHRDAASGRDVVVTPGCARPLSDAAERCALFGDQAADVERTPVTEETDSAIDIRGVRAGTNASALVFEIDVASLDAALPDGVDAQSWSASAQLGSKAFNATASRTDSGQIFTWSDADGATNDGAGRIDIARNAVTMVVPRAALGIANGTQITGITAHAADLTQSAVETQSDDAPNNADEGGSFAAGVPCARQALQLCPVVADPAGDAGPIVTYDGRSLPQNQDALDVLSAGAETNDQSVVVSMRIADIGAEPPAGYDTVGYTVSWHRNDGRRFYAQAYRTGAVSTFAYGIDATADDGPSGAVFGGVQTTGTIDTLHSVVKIVVPRSVIGGGIALPRFGSTSWALVTGNTVGTYKVIDATSLGWYRLGITCAA